MPVSHEEARTLPRCLGARRNLGTPARPTTHTPPPTRLIGPALQTLVARKQPAVWAGSLPRRQGTSIWPGGGLLFASHPSKQQLDETQPVPRDCPELPNKARQNMTNPSRKGQEYYGNGRRMGLAASRQECRTARWLAGLAGWLAELRGAGEHGTTSYPCSLNREPACLSGYSCCASGLQHLATSLVCASETALLLARDTHSKGGITHPRRHSLQDHSWAPATCSYSPGEINSKSAMITRVDEHWGARSGAVRCLARAHV